MKSGKVGNQKSSKSKKVRNQKKSMKTKKVANLKVRIWREKNLKSENMENHKRQEIRKKQEIGKSRISEKVGNQKNLEIGNIGNKKVGNWIKQDNTQ